MLELQLGLQLGLGYGKRYQQGSGLGWELILLAINWVRVSMGVRVKVSQVKVL